VESGQLPVAAGPEREFRLSLAFASADFRVRGQSCNPVFRGKYRNTRLTPTRPEVISGN